MAIQTFQAIQIGKLDIADKLFAMYCLTLFDRSLILL